MVVKTRRFPGYNVLPYSQAYVAVSLGNKNGVPLKQEYQSMLIPDNIAAIISSEGNARFTFKVIQS